MKGKMFDCDKCANKRFCKYNVNLMHEWEDSILSVPRPLPDLDGMFEVSIKCNYYRTFDDKPVAMRKMNCSDEQREMFINKLGEYVTTAQDNPGVMRKCNCHH